MKDFNKTSSIEDLIKISLDRVKVLMETNTIIGEPMNLKNGTTIIPISNGEEKIISADNSNSKFSEFKIPEIRFMELICVDTIRKWGWKTKKQKNKTGRQ